MKKKTFILCLMGLLLLAAGVAFTQKISVDKAAATGHRKPPPTSALLQPPPRAVVVEKISRTSGKAATRYPGTVQACRETRLAFRVGGPLVQVNIKPGDPVKKGDAIMQIDPQDYNDRIRVLEAQLAGARARLKNARRDFSRMEQLFKEAIIPQADFDRVGMAENTAHSQVKALQAQLVTARHQLSYTTLKAPYDAIVTSTHIENFEMTAPGQVVAGLHDISHLEITITIPENEIAGHPLVVDAPARARFPAVGAREFNVYLKQWGTSADPATRSYGATFAMPAPHDVPVLPGMTAEVMWPATGNQRPHLTIPAKSLVAGGNDTSRVWRFDPATATASRVSVTVGSLNGASRIVVKSGLIPGDLIVTDGMDFITEGMKLRPTPAGFSPGNAAAEAR